MAAELKPAYLIHGDDHGAVAERRAGLRALAERGEGGAASVETLDGAAATPAAVAGALAAMTLSIGRRVIIVEGAERWRQDEVEAELAGAIAHMPPDTTLAIFAREEARAKVPPAVHEAVRRAGGQVLARMTVKPWELARWTREQAARLGVELDNAAAKALVEQVGARQQRLLRELEKLALEGEDEAAGGSARPVGVGEIESRAAHSAEWQLFALADAIVGADGREATLAHLRLRGQGERMTGLLYVMAGQLREALAVSLRLQAGEPAGEVRRGLRMPARAAERFLADVARSDPERLRAALTRIADLELDSRGGAPVRGDRAATAALAEDTQMQRAIEAIAG